MADAGQIALQYMLMQSEGEKIYLFPAWPSTWDVSFKLHAPGGTVVWWGELRGGKLEKLEVTPESRRKDIIILPAAGIFAQDGAKTAETTRAPERAKTDETTRTPREDEDRRDDR